MNADPARVSVISISVPSDLPPIPGPSRATYKVERSRTKLFGRRRRSSFPSPPSGPTRRTYKAHGRGGRGASGRRWPKRLLVAVLVLIPLVLVAGVAGYFYVMSRLDGIPRVSVPALTAGQAGKPINILLIGSDSRACVGSNSGVTGQRSDVIIVARFISSTGQVEMLSIPRDTWVPIAGTGGANKINAAFNNGPNQLVETIQDDFHIPINHVMMTNFCGFSGMVDALGGISLNFPDAVQDQYSGLNIKTTGCQVVGGTQALALVRSRHLYYYKDRSWQPDLGSDWSRIRRQQAFFHALLDRVHGVFPNVFKLNAFLGATVSDLTVDSGFSSGQMMSLGLHFHSLGAGNLTTIVLPTSPETIDGQDALIAPQPYATRLIDQFLALGTQPTTTSTSRPSSSPSRTTTAPSTTIPLNVITDTPQDLPEPWNPFPC